MKLRNLALGAAFITALAACASIPVGPSIAVMPGPGKPFDQFNIDNSICKNFAQQELGTNPNDVAREQVLTGAATGAILGAASGALMGHGHDSPAGEMAGAGLIVGSAVGASAANQSIMTLQRRYDIAYRQCMYAKGNQVPGHVAPRYVLPPAPPPPLPRR